MKQPNILLFMVDQLTSFVLKAYGGPLCKTPNIDALAARGTVYETAYCAYPLCLPSRYSMMTGRLPSRIGAYDNGAELPASTPTFAHYLRSAGYYTCLSGKMHFVGPDQFHGFEDRLTTEIYPADMSWTSEPGKAGLSAGDNEGHGFGVSTIDIVKDAKPVARSMQIDYDEEVVHQAVRKIYDRARADDTRPFMLTVSLSQPHDPYVTTPEFWDLYPDETIDPPRVPSIPLADRDPHSQSVYFHYSQHKCDLSDQDYRNARRGYYGMISQIDAYLGKVMQALADAGFADDTVVLFTSDHGDMIGERGMWFKKTLYDPAIQVPLIVSQPNQAPARKSSPVSLLDIFPTLLEIGGVPAGAVRSRVDGVSLLRAERPGPVLVEHLDGGTAAPRVCLRRRDWKLVLSQAYPPLLFNLAEDPQECVNLAGRGLDIEAELTATAESNWSLTDLQAEISRSQSERKLVDDALAIGRQEPWDHTPRRSPQSPAYVRRGDTFPEVERRGYLDLPRTGD